MPTTSCATRLYIPRAIGIAPFLLSIALRSYLAAHNITRPLVAAMVLGNLANAGLDLVLIYGVGPLPALGVAGAAIATVSVQLAILAVYHAAVRSIEPHGPRPPSTRADLAEVLRYGLPVGGHLFVEIGVFGLATVLAAHMGKLPAGAHSVALNLASFTFSAAVGVGAATAVRVGHWIGAGDRGLARRRGLLGLRIGLAVMSVFAATFLIARLAACSAIAPRDPRPSRCSRSPRCSSCRWRPGDRGRRAAWHPAIRATFVGNVIGHYGVGLVISLSLAFGASLGAPGRGGSVGRLDCHRCLPRAAVPRGTRPLR